MLVAGYGSRLDVLRAARGAAGRGYGGLRGGNNAVNPGSFGTSGGGRGYGGGGGGAGYVGNDGFGSGGPYNNLPFSTAMHPVSTSKKNMYILSTPWWPAVLP